MLVPCIQTGSRTSDTPNITLTSWLLVPDVLRWSRTLKQYNTATAS